jgi:hypothetical protein
MLYYVEDISAAISEAWRLTAPGGVLTAGTFGAKPFGELDNIVDEVAGELGVPSTPPYSAPFCLDNGTQFFPCSPDVYEFETGYLFPDALSATNFMAAGPLWGRLGTASQDASIRREALTRLHAGIVRTFDGDHKVRIHTRMGFFLCAKSGL